MKILIYPEVIEKLGLGHLYRMLTFYNYIVKNTIHEVYFYTKDFETAKKISKDVKFISLEKNLEKFDIIFYDSPVYCDIDLKKIKDSCNKLILFDSECFYSKYVDITINLKKLEYNNPKVQVHEGFEYSIIREEIQNSQTNSYREIKEKPKLLLTFGGEDPAHLSKNILSILEIQKYDITLIIGYKNYDKEEIKLKYSDKIRILEPVQNLGEIMNNNDIIICSGGTTLMEAIYIGRPIVVCPQNEIELFFIKLLQEEVELFSIENLEYLISRCNNLDFLNNIMEKYRKCIDGNGMERILDIAIGEKI